MKRILIGTVLLAGVVLAGCESKSKGPRNLNNEVDSLSYCMGAMSGVMYWQTATMDTTLKTDAAREAYFAGIEAALKMRKEEAPTFHKGVRVGFDIDRSITEFEEATGVKLDRDIVLSAARHVIFNPQDANGEAIQAIAMMIDKRIRNRVLPTDSAGALNALELYAKQNGMAQYDDAIYYKVVEQGEGNPVGKDQRVALTGEFNTFKGSVPGIGVPPFYTPGVTFSENMGASPILEKMLPGSTVVVAATAPELLGPGFTDFNLSPTDILIVTFSFGNNVEPLPKEGSK